MFHYHDDKKKYFEERNLINYKPRGNKCYCNSSVQYCDYYCKEYWKICGPSVIVETSHMTDILEQQLDRYTLEN